MSREDIEIFALLDLKKKLAWIEYDKLNLNNLDPLRYEVEGRIHKLRQKCQKTKS